MKKMIVPILLLLLLTGCLTMFNGTRRNFNIEVSPVFADVPYGRTLVASIVATGSGGPIAIIVSTTNARGYINDAYLYPGETTYMEIEPFSDATVYVTGKRNGETVTKTIYINVLY